MKTFYKLISPVTIIALVLTIVAPISLDAAALTASKDTATRLQIATTADHTITTTMPTGVDFDVTGTQDGFQFDFPASFTDIGTGTWVNGDFTFTDSNGSHTVEGTTQGAGTITCTSTTAQNVCVAVDTTNNIFTVKPSTTYTASSTGSAITFTIDGTASDGLLTNPAAVAATNIDFKMCDNTASCFTGFTTSHSSQIAYGIIDDDTVAVTATVNASVTFDLDTAGSDDDTCDTDETGQPYAITLGTITNADPRVSGNADGINLICVDLDSNAAGGVVVTVGNANGASGLVSTSTPADDIANAEGAIATNSENYGLCVVDSIASTGTLDDIGDYAADTCAPDSHTNDVGDLTVSPTTIFNTAGAPIAGGRGSISVNASITIAQPAHADYTDSLTFIATGTF